MPPNINIEVRNAPNEKTRIIKHVIQYKQKTWVLIGHPVKHRIGFDSEPACAFFGEDVLHFCHLQSQSQNILTKFDNLLSEISQKMIKVCKTEMRLSN